MSHKSKHKDQYLFPLPCIKASQGPTGAIGADGGKGDMGTTGANGSTGQMGDTGANGSTGQMGDTGATGVTGQMGDTGANGSMGSTGADGSTGQMGDTGPSQLLINHTNFVDVNYGNDSTAISDDETHPWATLDVANTAALLRGTNIDPVTVFVQPGTYVAPPGGLQLATRVRWYLSENTRIVNSPNSPIFVQPATVNDIITTISGQGVFLATEVALGPSLGGGGVLHMLGNNGKVSLRGMTAVCYSGTAFLIGINATASTGTMNVELVKLEIQDFGGFENRANSSIEADIANIIVRRASLIFLTDTSGAFPLGCFCTLQTQVITVDSSGSSIAPSPPLGVVINNSLNGSAISLYSSIINAQASIIPFVTEVITTRQSMESITLIDAPEIINGTYVAGPGGAFIQTSNSNSTLNALANVIMVRGMNLFNIGASQSFINISGPTTVHIDAEFIVVFQKTVNPIILSNILSSLSISCQSLEVPNVSFGTTLLPFISMDTLSSSVVIDVDQDISVSSTFIYNPGPPSTMSNFSNDVFIRATTLNIQTNSLNNSSQPAIFIEGAFNTRLLINELNVNVANSSSQANPYALLDFRGNQVIFDVENLFVNFDSNSATSVGDVDLLHIGPLGPNPGNVQTTFVKLNITQYSYIGTNTRGIHVEPRGILFGNLLEYDATSARTLMILSENSTNLVNSSMNINNSSGGILSSDSGIILQQGSSSFRFMGNSMNANGQAFAIEIKDNSAGFITLADLTTDQGAAVLLNADTGSPFIQMSCVRVLTNGPSTTPATGSCIGRLGTQSVSGDFIFGDVSTGTCLRGFDFDTGGTSGNSNISLRANSLSVNEGNSYGTQAGIYWNTPGSFTGHIDRISANGLSNTSDLESALLYALGGDFHITVGTIQLTQDSNPLHRQGNFAPAARASGNCFNCLFDIGTVFAPGRVFLFDNRGNFLSARVRTIDASTTGTTEQTAQVDGVLVVAPFNDGVIVSNIDLVYSGYLRNNEQFGTGSSVKILATYTPGPSSIRQRASMLSSPGPCISSDVAGTVVITEPTSVRTLQDGNVSFVPSNPIVPIFIDGSV